MEEKQNTTSTTAVAQMGDFNALSMYFNSDQFATAQRVCQMLACSDLVPKEYQYKSINILNPDGTVNPTLKAQDDNAHSKAVANCMIALNKAAILHSDPLTIMQNMSIVYGRPSWSSSFLIGTVNSCGRYTPLKFKFGQNGVVDESFKVYKKGGESSGVRRINMPNTTCIAYATEKATGEVLEGAEVSIRLAFEENWIQKDGSKWLTMPQQMLMYRAAAFWTRAYAPDISQGMYTVEESTDIRDAEVISTSIKPERQRIQLPVPEENVEQLDNNPSEEPEPQPAEQPQEQPASETKTDDGAPY